MGLFDRLLNSVRSSAKVSHYDAASPAQDAEYLLDEGMALEQQGQLEEALLRYEAAIELRPELARAHFNRGIILLDRGEVQNALGAFLLALKYKPDSAAAHYNMGNAHLRLGHPDASIVAYQQAIALKPDFVDAHVALGAALEDSGQSHQAVASYQRALELKPDYAQVHHNLATTLQALGRLDEAAASYRRALVIEPDSAMGYYHLGVVLHELGQFHEAISNYRRALAITPDHVESLRDQGIALQELGQLDAAVKCYRQALEINPDLGDVNNNLANVLKDLGEFAESIDCYQRALAIHPALADVHNNLGITLQRCGRLDDAVTSYRQALLIKPEHAEAHNNLGAALRGLGQYQSALASFRQALQIKPDFADAHNNLGTTFSVMGQIDDSEASYRRALEIEPDNANAHMNLGNALKYYGQFEAALTSIRRALAIQPDHAVAQDNLLFIYNYQVDQSARYLLGEAQRYGEMVSQTAQPFTVWPNLPEPARSLRVGLMSGDLCQHPVGNFLEGVLLMLNARALSRLEFIAYPSAICNDEVSTRIKACCRGWHSVLGLPDERLAQQIRDDRIDILIDLSGHTAHNRLPVFAWKPAPVQVTWLGYLATTGVAAIDYLIADNWTLPQTEEVHFTEKIWRLPESYLCFTPPDVTMDMSPLPALSKGYVTFGSFNNLSKMNDSTVALWARVLASVPGSRLLLKSAQLVEIAVQQNVIARFGAHGIESARLILKALVPRAEYLKPYLEVDIALDPFPYPGITTSVESLWMGVPVLTLAGKSFLSRQGVGLLMNAGLPEWIAADPDDYVARAMRHASDLQGLAALRAGLRQRVLASPIFDARRFAEHFEAALRGMWTKWCDQNPGHTATH